MICEVERNPHMPLSVSPLKNSRMNLHTPYSNRYTIIRLFIFLYLGRTINEMKINKFAKASNNCTGNLIISGLDDIEKPNVLSTPYQHPAKKHPILPKT